MLSFRLPLAALFTLLLEGVLLCQTPLPQLERHWRNGEWQELQAWSDERLNEVPEDSLAHWLGLASSLVQGTAPLQRVEASSLVWEGEGDFWEANCALVEALRLQALGRHGEALPWFEAYFAVGHDDDGMRRFAEQQAERARLHAQPVTHWVALDPLELRAVGDEEGHARFDLPDSLGRWVKVPETLRSRFDRKANFHGDLFIRPGADRAWFASDREGAGTTDVYEVEIRGNGRFGKLRRLDEPVNSPYNERTPMFDVEAGRLYWSSDRPESAGGMDVFWTDLNGGGGVATPLPLALNSSGTETHFTPTGDGWTAWMVTRRMPDQVAQAVKVLLDGPTHRPVQVELAWDWSDGERSLSIWSTDARKKVWEGPLMGASGACWWTGWDGATYRALLTDRQGGTYTSAEWSLPTTAEPVSLRYAWEEIALAPRLASEEPWIGLAFMDPSWEALAPPLDERTLPVHPVWSTDLPEAWGALAETPWWQVATVHERWVAIRAFEQLEAVIPLPESPHSGGWEGVAMARSWSSEALKPIVERLRNTTNALDLICSAENSEGWEDVCTLWSQRIQADQATLTQARIWQQLGSQTAGYARLRDGMPLRMQRAMHQVEWYPDADQIMDRALEQAWSSQSYESVLGTEEVWRDWLWAAWQAFRSSQPEESPELLTAWWNLELAFELPVWANLSSAANSLADLVLGPEAPVEWGVPAILPQPSAPVPVAEQRPAIPASDPISVPADSVFAVQLGAFHDTPDGWAFWGVQNELKLIELSGWKKVVYGSYLNRNEAAMACAAMQQKTPFDDAFVVGFSEQEWNEARAWHELRMSGYGVHFVAAESEVIALQAQWKERFRAWPIANGQVDALIGPFWKQEEAVRAQRMGNNGAVLAFPEGLVMQPVRSAPTAGERTPAGRLEAVEEDASVWVVRIAEFPLGAPSTARAALLRLPEDLAVRSLPWGGGDAFITRKIDGEKAALRALAVVQAAGFTEARLLATSKE